MDRKDIKVIQGTKRSNVQHKIIDVKQIRMHPTFVDLLPIDDKLLAHIIQDMLEHGFYETEPVTLGIWPGLDEPVLIDGHARLRAAGDSGITQVPCVVAEFEDETAALQHAMSLQTKRRTTTDGALYRLCDRHDRLMERGGDRRSEEAISKGTHVPFDPEQSRSSQRTASLIGCNYKKVEKIRKIRKDGAPEMQRAVQNDKMKINRAYTLIRDMEKAQQSAGEKDPAAQFKPLKITFSSENAEFLQQLGGDVGDHVNKALEVYMRWLQGQESVLPAEHEPVDRQEADMQRIEGRP